jgi:hypothetical protein
MQVQPHLPQLIFSVLVVVEEVERPVEEVEEVPENLDKDLLLCLMQHLQSLWDLVEEVRHKEEAQVFLDLRVLMLLVEAVEELLVADLLVQEVVVVADMLALVAQVNLIMVEAGMMAEVHQTEYF